MIGSEVVKIKRLGAQRSGNGKKKVHGGRYSIYIARKEKVRMGYRMERKNWQKNKRKGK